MSTTTLQKVHLPLEGYTYLEIYVCKVMCYALCAWRDSFRKQGQCLTGACENVHDCGTQVGQAVMRRQVCSFREHDVSSCHRFSLSKQNCHAIICYKETKQYHTTWLTQKLSIVTIEKLFPCSIPRFRNSSDPLRSSRQAILLNAPSSGSRPVIHFYHTTYQSVETTEKSLSEIKTKIFTLC
jgi:hypothetical protein